MDTRTQLRAVVSTPHAASIVDVELARAVADRLAIPFVARDNDSVETILATNESSFALIARESGAALWARGNKTPLRFHGALGVTRARHVLGGGRDSLVEACGLRAGDVFVDATAGRCSDALVAEAAVGPTGRVIALESSPLLHEVMASGLRASGSRIECLCADHLDWLSRQADRSADVVYFDPMFRVPLAAQGDFELMRQLADGRELREAALREAARVARRRVVVLDGPEGTELARLGLRDATSGRWASRRLGILQVDG